MANMSSKFMSVLLKFLDAPTENFCKLDETTVSTSIALFVMVVSIR